MEHQEVKKEKSKKIVLYLALLILTFVSIFGVVIFAILTGLQESGSQENQQNLSTSNPSSFLAADLIRNKDPKNPGIYIDYQEGMENTKNYQWIVLFFYSSNCQKCAMLDQDLVLKSKDIPTGLAIQKVNMPENPQVVEKYEVKTPLSFILLSDQGKIIKTWDYGESLDDILSALNIVY